MAYRAAAQIVNVLMSYIALARKWRPQTFSQLVGQDHINKALINSLNQQRIHHAYLFTGTRGVGKTSIARLLAKALNCEQGISADPCLSCDTCLAIEKGCFTDLIEVDGASRTRVEDTRELLDNVHYAPTTGRFKIYLIDEVHMLSQHSFNALLKTLEEPPAHVKFLLATTDPQKLPVTVLSRCLQFNLKHLQKDVIAKQLQHILDDEHLSYESDAIHLLAHAAKGSMRDALSLLDQAIAGIDTQLSTQGVKDILGYTQLDYALQLLNALSEHDPHQLIQISRKIAQEGGYFQYTLEEMLSYLHQITINQHLDRQNPLISSMPEIQVLSTQFTKEDAQLFYQIGIKGTEEMHLAPTLAIGFEMTLLRMYTFQPGKVSTLPPLMHETAPVIIAATKVHETLQSCAIEPLLTPALTPVRAPNVSTHTSPDMAVKTTSHPITTPAIITLEGSQIPLAGATWSEIVTQLTLTGFASNAVEYAELIDKSVGNVILRVATGHLSLFTPSVTSRIEAALSLYYKEKIKLTLNSESETLATPAQQKKTIQAHQQHETLTALQEDSFFQHLKQEFSAELVKNSIDSLKDPL